MALKPEPAQPALAVQDLRVDLRSAAGAWPAVADLSFSIDPGETLCIVGESGCGKTMTALSLMRLQPDVAHIASGRALLDGEDMLAATRRRIEDLRGDRVAMIFQEPMTSLNPVMTIGEQIAETLRRHRALSKAQARAHAVEMLRLVRLPDPDMRADDYPHQLSGGQRQRAMIAIALACEPRLVIADEPTTALDVTVQAQILGLLRSLQQRLGAALLLITHDLSVVAEMADRVIVMYAGRKVEEASVDDLFDHPTHPYTRKLMAAAPRVAQSRHGGALPEIPGAVPPLWNLPAGCAFAPRCDFATARCRAERPPLITRRHGHVAACWEADQIDTRDGDIGRH